MIEKYYWYCYVAWTDLIRFFQIALWSVFPWPGARMWNVLLCPTCERLCPGSRMRSDPVKRWKFLVHRFPCCSLDIVCLPRRLSWWTVFFLFLYPMTSYLFLRLGGLILSIDARQVRLLRSPCSPVLSSKSWSPKGPTATNPPSFFLPVCRSSLDNSQHVIQYSIDHCVPGDPRPILNITKWRTRVYTRDKMGLHISQQATTPSQNFNVNTFCWICYPGVDIWHRLYVPLAQLYHSKIQCRKLLTL